MWPKILYDVSEYTALGKWKVFLDDLPRLHHVLGPIYTDGCKRYRVTRLKYPYDPGTYTFEPL